MTYRKGERTATHRAADHPYHVPMLVPGLGLGTRLDRMRAWCDDRRIAYETVPGRSGMSHLVLFAFKTPTDAEAFFDAWTVS